jgi:hypothetical protein
VRCGIYILAFLAGCDGAAGGPVVAADDLLDESLLDRSEDFGACGYPGEGENGYGIDVGQRLPPSMATDLINCEGEFIELADFFCKRDDDYGDYNRAILITIGAGWCEPCKEETETLMPDVYEPLHDQGLEIVQVIFEDNDADPPTRSFCREWRDELFSDVLEFPVLLDQTFSWADAYLLDIQAATPVTMLVDANGNIRWKVEGQDPDDTFEQAQVVMATPYGTN